MGRVCRIVPAITHNSKGGLLVMLPRQSTLSRSIIAMIALLSLLFAACESDSERTIIRTQPPVETVVPTATSMPAEDTPTATPTEEATGVPTEAETPVPTATAATAVPTFTPTLTPTGVPTGTVATATPTFSPTAVMTGTVATATPTATRTPTAQPGDIQLRGSIEQVYLTDAIPGTELELRRDGEMIASGEADARGSFIWRNLEPGDGYTVTIAASAATSGLEVPFGPVSVSAMTDHPDPSTFEGQNIGEGYGYLETRDGTLLAINVILPGPVENGPYPTLIEYSGYDPANPARTQPGVLIGPLMGFATVGVNMRGTGCSGGAFNYFEPAQNTDGYDAIEVIARQAWVQGGKVGMIGVSYPGISQLFTAQLQPPSLAAITPLSIISDTSATLYPGGILNNGFAVDWAADRQRDATVGGQGWSRRRIDEGDETCINNQKLKEQAPDIFQQIADNPFYTDEVAAPLSPSTFADRINVPVFLAGAWQDEQTGGYFPTILDRFTGNDNLHFTITNGGHTDSLGPLIFARWFEFFSLYVADRVPAFPPAAGLALAVLGADIFGVEGLTAPPDRFTGMSLEEARAAFEADAKVRILFDNGAGDTEQPGSPYPGFELGFEAWPIPELEHSIWYFDGAGGLVPEIPAENVEVSYAYNPDVSQTTNLTGGSSAAWKAQPNWHWNFVDAGDEATFTSAPLAEDMIMVGSASVDLWLKSTATDTDLQVTLSEIRPDGYEVYIQNGWLRSSRRVLDEERSSELRPFHTHREADYAPLTPGEFASVRVEMFPFAHAFRAGSQIRLAVGSPGGSRVLWKFDVLPDDGGVTNSVGVGEMYPSRVVLPHVPGVEIPTDYPGATALRAQPARFLEKGD